MSPLRPHQPADGDSRDAASGGGAAGSHDAPAAARISVRGVVQGVGFRPFVYSLAASWGVRGWVRNTSAGVEVLAEGGPDAVAGFAEALPAEAPPRSHIAACDVWDVEPGAAVDGPPAGDAFVILESAADPGAYQLVSPDIATCDDCRGELLDPGDRRHDYPFTNCTNCGPRFTIIEDLPYDRERTTMRAFPLCPACRREYEDPGDRRFHAEPNACPVCGPRVRLLRLRAGGEDDVVEVAAGAEGDPAAPIRAAAELLRGGEILAVKGLGGFHLACDATDGEAVRRLKLRKRRPDKPLAVMFAGLEELRAHCRVGPGEAALLTSPEHPIVLLEWREVGPSGEPGPEAGGGDGDPVDPEVAVRQRYLGAMLPYTPLHVLLLQAAGRPLVMTSGNLAEEPIVKGWEEIGRLTPIADAYLVHDREIAVRYDDSVAQVRGGRPRLIRRSRGYAPFPVALPRPLPQTLAAGAELKNTFCLTRDANAFLSQHIGDLENLETLEHYEASVEVYRRLFRLEPEIVAYDLHPGVPGDEVRARAAAGGQGRGAASPRARRGAAGGARPGGRRHRRQHGRPRLRRRRPPVGRRDPRLRPDRLPPGRALRGAPAAGRSGRDHPPVADRPRLELRAPRAEGSRPRRRAAEQVGRRRGGRTRAGRRGGLGAGPPGRPRASTRRSRPAAAACSTPSRRWPACAGPSATRVRRRSSWR